MEVAKLVLKTRNRTTIKATLNGIPFSHDSMWIIFMPLEGMPSIRGVNGEAFDRLRYAASDDIPRYAASDDIPLVGMDVQIGGLKVRMKDNVLVQAWLDGHCLFAARDMELRLEPGQAPRFIVTFIPIVSPIIECPLIV